MMENTKFKKPEIEELLSGRELSDIAYEGAENEMVSPFTRTNNIEDGKKNNRLETNDIADQRRDEETRYVVIYWSLKYRTVED